MRSRSAVRCATWCSRPVGAAQAEFGLEAGARGDRNGPARGEAGQVVRMHGGGPGGAGQARVIQARVGVHVLVEPVELAVRGRGPDLVRHGLGEGAELGLALAQAGFKVHALGDVAALQEDAEHAAVLASQRLGDEIDVVQLAHAVGLGQPDRARVRGVGAPGEVDLVQDRHHALRHGLGHRRVHGFADQRAAAGEKAEGRIHRLEPVLRPGQLGHEAGRLLEHRLQPSVFARQLAFGAHLGRGLDHDRDHADDGALRVHDRRVVEVHPDLLRLAAAVQGQLVVAPGPGGAVQAGAHRLAVEFRDFGPALAHLGAEQARVAGAGEARIGLVVDHDPILAPQGDDRNRRPQDQLDRGAQDRRPAGDRPQAGPAPVEFVDDPAQHTTARTESPGRCSRRNRHLVHAHRVET